MYHSKEETGQDRELNTVCFVRYDNKFFNYFLMFTLKNSSMYHWIEGGCARDKLNIGIPTYGRAFSGEDPIKAWGQSGGGSGGLSSKYLGESGIQTYFEV